MINPEHKLPIRRQAELLEISRSTVYYRPRPVSDADLMLMRRIDELHMNYPFAGSRMLRDMLSQQGLEVGRRHVRTLMRRMGIETLYRKPNTSKPAPGHRIYPYLLRGLSITRPNQVWAMDITYIPMARGFVYLAAVVDWFSRRVLAWRLSITMDTSLLHRGAGRGSEPVRQAGDLQHRSGQSVHQRSLHRAAQRRRHPDQHGRQGPLGRQRLRRAPLAFAQIRARLPARLRVGRRSQKRSTKTLSAQRPRPSMLIWMPSSLSRPGEGCAGDCPDRRVGILRPAVARSEPLPAPRCRSGCPW